MKPRARIIACLALALAVGATAAEALKSGPPVGEELPGSFEPLNITGPDAGEVSCIFCEYGEQPVVMVFAREMTEPLTRLIKRLDAATAQHKSDGLSSCVVFLNREPALPKQIKQVAEQEKIQQTILRTYKPEGPKGYNLAKDADVIVVLFTDRVVKANHAFKKGEMKDKDIDTILADLTKILPARK